MNPAPCSLTHRRESTWFCGFSPSAATAEFNVKHVMISDVTGQFSAISGCRRQSGSHRGSD
jgi:hypothetical protein